MIALIDYDVICYSAGFAVQHTYYHIGGKTFEKKSEAQAYQDFIEAYDEEIVPEVVAEPESHALQIAKQLIKRIVKESGADDYEGYLTGKGNYRESIATIKPYKGNRTASKPVHYESIKTYLQERHNGEVIEGQEADDKMGIVQSQNPDRTTICTIDKDLRMIPGRHYNWQTSEVFFVDEWEGIKWFYTQLLTGDTVDNIQGVPRIGAKKAEKILADCKTVEEMECAVGLAYACSSYEDPEAAMIENGRLLWIRRREGEFWEPLCYA